MVLVFTAFLEERGSNEEKIHLNSPIQNKGFINSVSCTNWAVRHPAGTLLDSSSLVNKQVVYIQDSNVISLYTKVIPNASVKFHTKIGLHILPYCVCPAKLSVVG